MCGRFVISNNKPYGLRYKISYNVAPSQLIPVKTKYNSILMKWSYAPLWKRDMNLINGRSETINEKPSFKNAKRCVIGLYACKKVNQDFISSNLRKKVNNKLASEQQRKQEKFARDRLTRKQREDSKLSQFTHKGITYVASKRCSDGKQFYWNVEKGFLQKERVIEIGCLSDYELQSLKNQARNKSGGGSSRNVTNQMDIQTKIMSNNAHRDYMNFIDSLQY